MPLSVQSGLDIGLDVRAYLEEDLVDILIAGQDYIQMAVASSLGDMVDLGHQYQVPVYALLVPPKPYDRYRYDNRAWWAAAMNRWYWGADGIYLFNLFPEKPDERFSQLGSVETLKGRDKIYAIDNPAQEDVLGTFKMVMVGPDRLPISIAAGQRSTARLPVGEDIVANTPAGQDGLRHASPSPGRHGPGRHDPGQVQRAASDRDGARQAACGRSPRTHGFISKPTPSW